MIFIALKDSQKHKQTIEKRIKDIEKRHIESTQDDEEQLPVNFLHSLVKMGWAQKPETEEEVHNKKIQYEQKLKMLEKTERDKIEYHIKEEEKRRREYAISMLQKGVDDVLFCNKKYLAESIQETVSKFNKSRRSHMKEVPLIHSKFEVLN